MSKLKRTFLVITIVMTCFAIDVSDIWADETNGTGAGSSSSNQAGSETNRDTFEYSSQPYAYKIQLVYKAKNNRDGGYDKISCAVVNRGADEAKVKDYIKNDPDKNEYQDKSGECRYISSTDNILYKLATIVDESSIDKYFDSMTIEDRKNAKNYFNALGLKIGSYHKEGSKFGTIDSYGYRILIQQITCIGSSGNKCTSMGTRKEKTSTQSVFNVFAQSGGRDIFTTKNDMGIYRSAVADHANDGNGAWKPFYQSCNSAFNTNNSCGTLYWMFADWHDGTGFNIIGFNPEIFKAYDYSIDAACEDCSSKTKKGSYQIQDTNDWEAILASAESENSNVKNYYKKNVDGGCQVYCREEFNVVFPNENNKIYAESGRYFTVNKQSTGVMIGSGVSNFKPIKVNKTRQCRATGSNQRECLQNFVNNNTGKDIKYTYPAAGHSGSITLTYKEKKYDITVNLEENVARTVTNDEIIENHIDNSDYILTSTSTKWFELPKDTYRYVGSDGLSYSKKPTDNKFTDTGTENLPISFENDAEKAMVILKYALPKNDGNSKMYEAFNANNDYFGTKNNNVANIYSKEKNNELENNEFELIKGSACAKLYGYGTSEYYACRNERIINKAGKCYSEITKVKYTCDVVTCPKGEKLCDNGECSTDGGKCSTKNPKCKIVGQKYYDASGNEVTKEKYESQCGCSIRNGQYYDENNNVIDEKTYMNVCPINKCTVVTGKSGDKYYYNSGGKLVTKEEYDKDYNANCKKEVDYCKACNGGVCCPDTDMVCPDENGNCPVPGGKKIIYRTIDLDNPFPSLTGLGRKTGANWCSYNINTKKVSCANTGTAASGNAIVYKHILNNRNIQSKSVYSATPLYEVKLDSKTISAVKSYNRSHEYDDFELTCNKKTCKSNGFLRGVVNITQGKCKSGSMSNLESCAEVKG